MKVNRSFTSADFFRGTKLFCFVLMLFLIFGVSAGCKKKPKEAVWQKIRVSTLTGKAVEIKNPEIDYSSSDGTIEDYESFGIRVQAKDDMTIVPWTDIKDIQIALDKENLLATISRLDGGTMTAMLVEDSTGGLKGMSGSNEVIFRLRDIQKIDVMHEQARNP